MEYLEENDNFVWTDASSSASSDSDSSMKNKMGDQSGGEESEYDKTYKKQLHQELFNDHNDDQQHTEKKKNKKKRKLERETSDSETNEPPRRKKIKREPDSDIDTHHKTYKHKEHDPYDDHFLDEQVKKEQSFIFPEKNKSKKKKHKSTSQTNDLDCTVNNADSDTVTLSRADTESTTEVTLSRADTESTTEVTLSRADTESTTEEPSHQQQHTTNKKKKKKRKSEKRDNSPDDNEVKQPEDNDHTVDLTVNVTNGDPDVSEISKISKGNFTYNESYNTSMPHTQTRPKLAEKLLFEDDLIDLDGSETQVNTSRTVATQLSDKLKKFVTTNTKLKPCNIPNSNNFSIDNCDEVWIIKCPSDVDISAFRGKSLNLENKCKIKLNGLTYEGNTDPIKTHTSIITSENGQITVNNVAINGYLNLHKRLPKVQMHEDSVMVNNQTNFIPLPDTKCRHPLLGSHYKRAMKLPPRVAERLRTIHSNTDNTNKMISLLSEHHTPKAEKGKKLISYDQEQMVTDDTTIHLTKEDKKKKKKKRKHSEVEEEQPASSHKKKRKKYKLEEAETWESEHAIEQSLFH